MHLAFPTEIHDLYGHGVPIAAPAKSTIPMKRKTATTDKFSKNIQIKTPNSVAFINHNRKDRSRFKGQSTYRTHGIHNLSFYALVNFR